VRYSTPGNLKRVSSIQTAGAVLHHDCTELRLAGESSREEYGGGAREKADKHNLGHSPPSEMVDVVHTEMVQVLNDLIEKGPQAAPEDTH
jgi:hypothetical protein